MYGGDKSKYYLNLQDTIPCFSDYKIVHGGSEIQTLCPVCEKDKFKVTSKDGHLFFANRPDAFLCDCKHHCAFRDIIRAYRDKGAKHIDNRIEGEYKLIENYDHIYCFPDGTEAYRKTRKKYFNGVKYRKEFPFSYIDLETGEKIYKHPPDYNKLYKLELLEEASKRDIVPVLWLCEGEKCVDAMIAQGLVATTSATGASGSVDFTDVDREMLSRFPIKVFIGDNDDIGKTYRDAWGKDIFELPITEIWPKCPHKGDIADYFALGKPVQPLLDFKAYKLDENGIANLSKDELLSKDFFKSILRLNNKSEQIRSLALAESRIAKLNVSKRMFKELWRVFLQEQGVKGEFKGNRTQFQNAPVVQLECGEWIADMTGIYRMKKNEDDELENEYASMIPIVPSAILENQEDDGTEKIAVSLFKKNDWRTVNIPKEVLVDNSKIIKLATIGADVSSLTSKLLIKYFTDVINLNEGKTLPTLKTVSHLGWHKNEFVPYSEDIQTDLEQDFTNVLKAVQSKGTLKEWVDFIKPLRKNKHLRLVLDASFASVLVEKVNGLSFFVHLYGSTGFGKTLSLMLAASVWGNPGKKGLVFPLNSTLNYVARLAGVLKNIPLCGDELQMIKTAYGNYDRLIMTLSEGEEKGRLSKDIIARKKGSWNLVAITTGEEPIAKYDSGGGAVNRVIEVYCDKPITDNGPEVAAFITEHYGVAGRAFIEALPSDDDIKAMFKWLQESFAKVDSTSKQVMAMSLLALADVLTCENIFHDEVMPLEDFASFLKTEQEVDASERAYEALQGMIIENRVNFNDEWNGSYSGDSNKLWGCFTDNEIHFVAGVLKKEFGKLGYHFDDYKQKWVEKGYIKKFGIRYDTPKRIMHGDKQVRCIVINRGEWV